MEYVEFMVCLMFYFFNDIFFIELLITYMYYHTAIPNNTYSNTQSLKPFILKPHNRKIPQKKPWDKCKKNLLKSLILWRKTPQELYQKAFPRKITSQKASPRKMLRCHFPISFLVHMFDLTTGYVWGSPAKQWKIL